MTQDLIPSPPPDLLRAFEENEVVLYAGAGLSHESGFPLWPDFVASLLNLAIESGAVDRSFAESLSESVRIGKTDFVADAVVSALREKQPGQLEAHLLKVFRRPSARLTPIHEELQKLKFRAAMTTNFDELLEMTFSDRLTGIYRPADTQELLNAISKREFFILKLYGSVLDRDVLVAPAQYEEVIRGNRAFSAVIETLFFSSTIFFLGASLEGIEAYLRGISLPGAQRRTHFALVAVSGTAWRTSADILRRRYGIEVLPIGKEGHIGARVLSFVRQFSSQVAQSQPTTSPRTRHITRVALNNVGPFTSLDLNLDREWNVLLGDNGVGKSTIIRAIAAALIGRQAPHSDRLIKTGASRADITIYFGNAMYKTEIFRGATGGAEIVSHVSPIETGGILALGFPALRTVSWNRPSSPAATEAFTRPSPADLSPLLGGGSDPRMDELKQWIVNIDYRAHAAEAGGTSPRFREQNIEMARAYRDTLKTFFDIVGKVTEGITIDFDHVNPQTFEISIRTQDGPLPLEALSQGTISLLGWIGILVQRLSEASADDSRPISMRPAIVLIDEIDAHLHPAWQQVLVARLSDQFPNIQFIATTHSPLIVGGMRAAQVFRFVRGEEGEVEQVEVEQEMTVGRTDQILTGDLFGLDTTLDSETLIVREEYRALLGKRNRLPEEETRLRELEGVLEFRIPPTAETPVERQAYQLLELLLRHSVGEKNADVQRKVLDAGKKLLSTLAREKSAKGMPK